MIQLSLNFLHEGSADFLRPEVHPFWIHLNAEKNQEASASDPESSPNCQEH